jgi:mono/diheme cytochrome c family protein
MKKLIYTFVVLGSVSCLMSACSAGGENTGLEYAPNMYVSLAYEPFSQLEEKPNSINPYGINMREPVKGTIARGQMDYATYGGKASNEGYEAASAWKNPLPKSKYNLAEGERLYNINCTPCHGEDGLGKGTIVAAGKFPQVPAYADRLPTINDGKAFYTITHGKNLMGPYGPHLSPTQRWQVIHYINNFVSGAAAAASQDNKTASN